MFLPDDYLLHNDDAEKNISEAPIFLFISQIPSTLSVKFCQMFFANFCGNNLNYGHFLMCFFLFVLPVVRDELGAEFMAEE